MKEKLACLKYNRYLCTNMASLDTITISYRGKEYSVAYIPNVFTSDNQKLLIGSHSLNVALYDDNNGYVDDDACKIDEQIYAFVDDKYFSLNFEKFMENVKVLLD